MLNEVKLIGRLGKDPEISYTPAGVAITKSSAARRTESDEHAK